MKLTNHLPRTTLWRVSCSVPCYIQQALHCAQSLHNSYSEGITMLVWCNICFLWQLSYFSFNDVKQVSPIAQDIVGAVILDALWVILLLKRTNFPFRQNQKFLRWKVLLRQVIFILSCDLTLFWYRLSRKIQKNCKENASLITWKT